MKVCRPGGQVMKFNPAIAGLLSSLSVRGPTKAHEPKRSEALDSALGNAFGYFPCLQLYFNFNYLFSVTSCILVYFLSCPVLFRLFSCPPLQNAEDSHNPTSQPHLTTYLPRYFATPLHHPTRQLNTRYCTGDQMHICNHSSVAGFQWALETWKKTQVRI